MNEQSSLLGSTGSVNQVGQNPQMAGGQSLTPSNTPLQTNAVSLFDGRTQTINVGGSGVTATAPAGALPTRHTTTNYVPIAFGVLIGLCVVIAIVIERLKAKSWDI